MRWLKHCGADSNSFKTCGWDIQKLNIAKYTIPNQDGHTSITSSRVTVVWVVVNRTVSTVTGVRRDIELLAGSVPSFAEKKSIRVTRVAKIYEFTVFVIDGA